jgi:hypothetical protein
MRRTIPPLAFLLAAALLLPAQGAGAAERKRCDRTTGRELAHSTVVKVYKVRTGRSYRYFGCARPRGPVNALTKPFTGTQVKLLAAKGAYVAFSRTIRTQDTISVVDARTGRQRHGLYPPFGIEFDVDPETPQIGAVRLNFDGELAVTYLGLGNGRTTDSTTYVYAFDARGHQQLLDSGPSRTLPPRSVRLTGKQVSWTNAGKTRSARIGAVSLQILSAGGPTEGDVTTSPEGGIACHVGPAGLAGICVGSFDPNTMVTITATGAANSTVTISGACSAVHAPVIGQVTSVATCTTQLFRAQTARVRFG